MVFSAELAAFTIPHADAGNPLGSDLMLSYHDNDHYNSVRSNVPVPASNTSTQSNRDDGDDAASSEKEKKKAVKRSDPCICGSGFTYKKCCFGKDKNEARLQKKNGSRKETLPDVDEDDSVEQGFRVMAI